jgi:uncharacterized protein YbjT (DUF2867 family)
MKIVVTTPTGHAGSRVTRLLAQAGVRPTLFLRHPGALDEELRGLLDTVAGDQLDAGNVLRATEGAAALFWVDRRSTTTIRSSAPRSARRRGDRRPRPGRGGARRDRRRGGPPALRLLLHQPADAGGGEAGKAIG